MTGLLILRIVVGALLIGHGTQKLLGWFGGHGIAGTAGFFSSIGFRPGRLNAFAAGASEAGGGLLLALGLITPLAAAAVLGTMVVAASVHFPKFWVTDGGFEYPFMLGTVAVALGFTGPGRLSLDNAFGLDAFHGGWGWLTVTLGLGAGLAMLVRRRSVLAADQSDVKLLDQEAAVPVA